LVLEHRGELPNGVLVGGVLGDGPRNDRGALRVDVDRVDESAGAVFSDVEVAELRSPDAATALDLGASLARMSSPEIRTWTSFMMSVMASMASPM
jgi:hypothetical protein